MTPWKAHFFKILLAKASRKVSNGLNRLTMKQLFAIFCAIFLMPMVSAQAWIGGPFSNNTYFGEQGDDGVYEAIGTGPNALGIFRIVVGNQFQGVNPQGVQASGPSQESAGVLATVLTVPGVSSGNVVIGALGRPENHLWYFEGVSYLGLSIGTASSILGTVAGIGNAEAIGGVGNRISSSFTANMRRSGRFLPATAFFGSGTAQVTNGVPFGFFVMGSKVSSRITFGL